MVLGETKLIFWSTGEPAKKYLILRVGIFLRIKFGIAHTEEKTAIYNLL